MAATPAERRDEKGSMPVAGSVLVQAASPGRPALGPARAFPPYSVEAGT
jgi:hypothetical protein